MDIPLLRLRLEMLSGFRTIAMIRDGSMASTRCVKVLPPIPPEAGNMATLESAMLFVLIEKFKFVDDLGKLDKMEVYSKDNLVNRILHWNLFHFS